ncbi:MarC family protein [Lysobacter niabensis]|uniref:MarC family protein n=1 Tax=Agrilutibacter niabensis TaxID=380628 RepID=UPI003615A38A
MYSAHALMQVAAQAPAPDYRLAPAEIFLLFFIMLGPLKVIGPFASAAHGLSGPAMRMLAFKTFTLSVAAVIGGGFIGNVLLGNWKINSAVMELAGGLIFTLAALQMVMQQYDTAPVTKPAPPGLMHLVFPVIVTPYGMATVIVLLALARDASRDGFIIGIALVVLVLNLLAMLAARSVMRWIALPLQILGAVLGVLQVALGLKILIDALRALGVDLLPM